jgi:hypothetical protein
MAKRKPSKSSLYELIKTRPRVMPEEPPGGGDVEEVPAGSFSRRWLSPGRTVTLPVGYVLLAAAVVSAAVVGAYVFGYGRASELERERFEQRLLARAGDLDESTLPRDPLMDGDRPGGGILGAEASGGGGGAADRVSGGAAPGPAGPDEYGPIESDPRQRGFRYFVLMTTNRDGALLLVEFCRQRELETYAIARNNGDRFVIALPGLPPGMSNQAPEYRALRNRIEAIGTEWLAGGGLTDLHDAYPLLYDPQQ